MDEKFFAVSNHERTAVTFTTGVDFEVNEFSGATIKSSGNRASPGDQQILVGGDERSLWSHTGEGRGAMGLFDILGASAVVDPFDCAGVGVQGE